MTVRKLKPVQCLFYVVGQMIGAFLGALVVYALYWNLFNEYDGGVRLVAGTNGTADIFFTMPSKGVEHWNSFFDQIVGTAVLMIFVMALGNVRPFRSIASLFSSLRRIYLGQQSYDVRSGQTLRLRSDHSRYHLGICRKRGRCNQSCE